MNKRIVLFSMPFLLIFFVSANLFAQPKNTEKKDTGTVEKKDTTSTQPNDDREKKRAVTFGGQVYGTVKLYIEASDLMRFNSRYYSKVVYIYAYFLARPHELRIVFRDYRKNHMILHMIRSNLYNLPNLYKDKLYEIRAKVGKVRQGRLHLKFVSMIPMFTERGLLDQIITQ